MKIIECMNELKLTEKKLRRNEDFCGRYSARASFVDDPFKESGGSEGKIQEKLQSSNDLIERHEWLKRAIDYTNLMATVKVGEKTYSLHSLILHKRLLCKLKKRVFSALNDAAAHQEVNRLRMQQAKESKVTVQVIYCYDIQSREDALAEIDELESQIDSALQIANSKLDIVEPPVNGKEK